ncbi:MAG: ATP-binding protein [Gammaproteobacteria bacterium]|nr:ATP-binding protein [Gammaproteobacteria bacterium]
MKIRVLSLIVVPTLLVLMMFALFIQRDMNNLEQEFEDHGSLIANQMAIASEYGAITENIDTLKDAVRSVIKIKDVNGVVILSPEQQPYVETGFVQFIMDVPGEFQKPYICHKDDSFSIFCAPILYTPFGVSDFEEDVPEAINKVFIGSIQVSISSRILTEKRDELFTYAMAFIFFTVFATLLMARRIQGQIIEPILELTNVVNGIGSGDLEQRAILKSSGEIELLQDGVNHMAKELNSYHTEMKSKVDNATKGLRSAIKEIEEKNNELEIAWNRAEEASHAKSLFLAAMSHEIRTPLSGMLGMLNLIEQSELDQEQREQISNIEQASNSLKSLIDDILDFSRIEAGKLNIVNKPFSICKLIDEVVTMLAPSAQLKGLELMVDIEHTLPMQVVGDSLRVRQVLINILSNAIKFTEQGDVTVRIRQEKPVDANNNISVCLEVIDTGIGIPEERQGAVFEHFSQVDQGRERRYEGSGLGAATAKQLVELMGGDISLESQVGVGSHFTIHLHWPLQDNVDSIKSGENLLRGESILVIDSHQQAGDLLKRYLEELGATVLHVSSLNDLKEHLAGNRYSKIILTDEFNRASTHALLRESGVQKQGDGGTQIGTISSFSHDKEESSVENQIDFRWSKPLTPDRIIRLVSLPNKSEHEQIDSAKHKHLSLLVAEDDDINAKVITFLIERRGHRVIRVKNGEDALCELNSGQFDAVFMDVRMPKMSGIEATAKWRLQEEIMGKHIPIVALTANDSEQEICADVGMDGFILKPITDDALDQLDSMIPGIRIYKI